MRNLFLSLGLLTLLCGCSKPSPTSLPSQGKIELVKNIDSPKGEHTFLAPPRK